MQSQSILNQGQGQGYGQGQAQSQSLGQAQAQLRLVQAPAQRPNLRPRTGWATARREMTPSEMKQWEEDNVPTAKDSLTLGQLKSATAAMQAKQKTQLYDFRYDDTDTLMNELQEFYPYIEMLHVAKNPEKFKGSFSGEWTKAPMKARKAYVETQLELLESPVHDTRRAAQVHLLYLLQGSFAETESPEDQLHWIMENARTIRAVDGVPTIVQGLRGAAKRYDSSFASTSEKPMSTSSGSSQQHANHPDAYDDRSAELMDFLGMIYFIVEVFRTDETFGDELMAMSPPLPLVLFEMVAGLKDRLPKGYPVKKVLLLLWKTLLATLGGMREVTKAKALSRELAGLPPDDKDFTTATPIDIAAFRRDTSVKYPTFAPPPSTSNTIVPDEKLAESFKPIPVRPSYHASDLPVGSSSPQKPNTSLPLPGTPAPTPPASPQVKPKKQQYQTDPNRPFVFPYTRSTTGHPSSLVPFAIDEADKLYQRHAYVSLGLYQIWEAREECLREERGLGVSGLIGFQNLGLDEEDDVAAEEAMRRDWKYEEEEVDCQARGDKEGVKNAREKRAAARRLYRVEVIYKSTLPIMQSCVIVLLKLLLATVTGPGPMLSILQNNSMPPGLTSPQHEVPPPVDERPRTREEIDIARHREITSKAVSAILILILKWFKASHILKFHNFAQLLLDSNCILLVLKMFGLNEVSEVVHIKNEWEDWNFFRYCQLNCSKVKQDSRPEDHLTQPTSTVKTTRSESDEEVEVVSDYSWRNFFSSINFVKILQKMTKHRVHRIGMLVQYKSSQILKRMLKINQPMLQLQVLKLIKSQMPYNGRKWRQVNMKVITAIYLNCRPDLRDEWLAGVDVDAELEEAVPREQALRSLNAFYNKHHYGPYLAPLSSPEPKHQRSNSTSAVILEDPALQAVAEIHHRPSSAADADVFPPNRSTIATNSSLPYNPDGMIDYWMNEYEYVLSQVFGDGEEEQGIPWAGIDVGKGLPGPAERNDTAWKGLEEIMRAKGGVTDEDGMSDSESVASVGELGEEARYGTETELPRVESGGMFGGHQRRKSGEGENTWEHMSPTTLSLLPRSPSDRRRSSSGGSPLRPVMPIGVNPDAEVFDEEEVRGPIPMTRETPDEEDRNFAAVDEVEYAYGE